MEERFDESVGACSQVTEATDCDIGARAFAGCDNLVLAVLNGCRTEADSFDPAVIRWP